MCDFFKDAQNWIKLNKNSTNKVVEYAKECAKGQPHILGQKKKGWQNIIYIYIYAKECAKGQPHIFVHNLISNNFSI